MRVLVDLNRCQSYGQCVFAAPDVFRMKHDETLEWDYQPPAEQEARIVRAVHACPVQAITWQAAPMQAARENSTAGSPSGSTR